MMKPEGLRTVMEYDKCGSRVVLRDEAFRAKLVAMAAVAGDSSSVRGYCRCSYCRYIHLSNRGVLLLFLESHGCRLSPETKKKKERTDVL